jgi:hypothetical protein
MGVRQQEPQLQQMLRLFFEGGEVFQSNRWRGIGFDPRFDFPSGRGIEIIIGVDSIEQPAFCFSGEDRSLIIDPAIQFPARVLIARPGVCVMVSAVAQHRIIQFKNLFLDVIGNLKTLELHRGELLPQFPTALPGVVRRPGDDANHSGDRQDECRQPKPNAHTG